MLMGWFLNFSPIATMKFAGFELVPSILKGSSQ